MRCCLLPLPMRRATILGMGKRIIEGHEIDIADAKDLEGVVGKPIKMVPDDQGIISSTIPVHPTKSIFAKFELAGENLPHEEYFILIPPGESRTRIGMSEIRPFRNEWTLEDIAHQQQLFDAIGKIAVFGGHVEMAMKKVLITLRGGNRDLLDPTLPSDWDGLEKELRKLCDGSDDVRTKLSAILNDSDEKQLRDKRNDAIHGYWWLIPAHGRLINARYYRPKKGNTQMPVSIYNKIQDVRDVGDSLYLMSDGLQKLVTPHWPIAFFADTITHS